MTDTSIDYIDLVQRFIDTETEKDAEDWLRTTPAADATFVDVLLLLTDRARLSNAREALALARHAVFAAAIRGTRPQLAARCHFAGLITRQRGETEAARKYLASSELLFDAAGDESGLAYVRLSQGDEAREARDLSAATKAYELAANWFAERGDRRVWGRQTAAAHDAPRRRIMCARCSSTCSSCLASSAWRRTDMPA